MSEPKKNTMSTKTITTIVLVVVLIAVAVWAIFTYVVPQQDEEVTPADTVTTDAPTTEVTDALPTDSGSLLVWDKLDYVA